jgi:hypothetical protein
MINVIDDRINSIICKLGFPIKVVSGSFSSNSYYKLIGSSGLMFNSNLLNAMDSYNRNAFLMPPSGSNYSPLDNYLIEAELKNDHIENRKLDEELDPAFVLADRLLAVIGIDEEGLCPEAKLRGWIVLFADNSEWEDEVRWEDGI